MDEAKRRASTVVTSPQSGQTSHSLLSGETNPILISSVYGGSKSYQLPLMGTLYPTNRHLTHNIYTRGGSRNLLIPSSSSHTSPNSIA
ncbi:hypothetical protein CO051_00595 [Candidatus Roizmanbacteria bacterium CG_4_9_14_0_2_um_filter_39_13]|uniref:Uncharacterized protein n=1 Tax=Candidatus Roizmanbacteria bacterium CG_4_9_14_0_2_um_filter_39_13 TaxID=1974839 RepID=A0A2M8F3T8_9BACT|nr:MAG: hypothetical protein COY15_03750 [Candidatus Roizmanbacteria bacterium CG_4_10_14_0_2_um_filter_39_12]PJC33974.1 MAG: hypothetical protein CO051_00595 [Candidatus Roizmanbacteria bacterium CG_4_9_14_0_2_um_filter_39_13]